MSGPWEKYQTQQPAAAPAADGPWKAYARSGGAQTAPVGGRPTQQASEPVEGLLSGNESAWDRGVNGMQGSTIKAVLGVKQLFGKLSPEDENVLKQIEADEKKSGFAGGVGGLAGNVASGVAASILAPELGIAGIAGKAAPYVKAALGSGIMAGATSPIEGAESAEDILKGKAVEAGKAAVAGPATILGGQVLKKSLTKPFQATADAVQLMGQKIYPTLQQGAESAVGKVIGGLSSGFTKVRQRQEGEVLQALEDRVGRGNVSNPGGTLGETNELLGQGLDTEYNNLFGGKLFPLTNKTRNAMRAEADNAGQGTRLANERDAARGVVDNILGTDTNNTRMTMDNIRRTMLNPMQEAAGTENNAVVKQAILNAKTVLEQKSVRAKLSQAEQDQLDALNARYYDLSRMREVATGGDSNLPGIDMGKLARSYEANPSPTSTTQMELVGPLARTMGTTPRQDEARTLLVNLQRAGKLALGAGAATVAPYAAAPLYGLSMAGQTRQGAKYLFGQNKWQKDLASALESPQMPTEVSAANFLRALRDNSSNLGAALTAD